MIRILSFIVLLLPLSAKAQETAESYIADGPISILMEHDDRSILDSVNTTNESLYEALALAYQNNPTLLAARAELVAVQEQLDQAQAGFKPTITAEADITHTNTDTEGQSFITGDGGNTSKAASLNLNQPLFRGGTTVADIRAAKNTITAQSLSLSATEQGILYDVAVAYMNVLRDKAVLELNQNNRRLVSRELEQAQNRFTVGELTQTDVSQSKARLAEADAAVINANGNYKSAIAVYRRLVGSPPPIDIGYPVQKFVLPKTLEEAINLAETNNRDVLQSKFVTAAAEDNVDSIFGELLPQISAIGKLNKSYDPSDFIEEQRQGAVGITASIPLYQAGSTRSRVREAKKQANQRYLQILEAKNQARQDIISNWEQLEAARAETRARTLQIEAARIAREGVHYETEFGERTTLDSLNANQELLDAQVNYIKAKRGEVVARFALARSLGVLVPQNLGFSTITP